MKFRNKIQRERSLYDRIEEYPKDKIWQGVEEQLKNKRKPVIWKRASIAASITILAVSAFFIGRESIRRGGPASLKHNSMDNTEMHIAVRTKMKQIGIEKLDKIQYTELFNELDYLDSLYMTMKEDIRRTTDQEKAINLIIQFQERKLRILELLEKEIEFNNKNKRYEERIKI